MSQHNPTAAFKRSLLVTTALGLLLAGVAGCGSHSATAGAGSSGFARATFTIHWPAPDGRTVPAGANRIVVTINGDDFKGTKSYVYDRQGSATTATIALDVPAGHKLLFAAEARKVTSTKFTAPVEVSETQPAVLTEGTLLASGNDGTAHDFGIGDRVAATVNLQPPAGPKPGTTTVTLTVNQVLPDRFPAVLVLQVIRDQNGDPISNLSKGNFEVTEDGRPAVISDVRTVTQARKQLSASLVLDRSGSMSGQPNADLEEAAASFVDVMQSDDYGEVINFSDKNQVEVTQPLTKDKQLLLDAVIGHFLDGGTALYDAVSRGLRDLSAAGGRRAVIAMTDGGDNASDASESSVIAQATQASVPLFTVGLNGNELNQDTLRNMADQTGGIYAFSPTSAELTGIYAQIADQLNSQVQIFFTSPDPVAHGRLRRVVVKFHYGTFSGEASYQYTY